MPDGDKIIQLHAETSPEEQARRLRVEVERLAALPTVEWMLYVETGDTAEKFGLTPAKLKQMVEVTIRANAKREREAKADDRREKQQAERTQAREDKLTRQEQERARKDAERARKETERIEREQEARQKRRDAVFAEVAKLPKLTHAGRLKEAAKRLEEDFEVLFEEFQVYFAARSLPEELTPWDEPVPTAELLNAIEVKFSRYVVASKAVVTASTLWTAFTWVIELAVHAPKLCFHFPEPASGKTTALNVLRWMVQRPYMAVEATGAATYRIVDRLKPTLLLDEADTLFDRSTVLAHIINASWTSGGQKIPRVGLRGEVIEFDPYSTQAIGMKGLNMPGTTSSRTILCMLWPKLPSEEVEDFSYVDDDEFKAIRRKLLRWSVDNAVSLREAKPMTAPGFNNRIRMNFHLLFAIADLASGEWPKRAREAALELMKDQVESSEGMKAICAMDELLEHREKITSAEVIKTLAADPTSEWSNFRGKGPISQTQFAALLKPYGIRPVKVHPTNGYRKSQFADVFARLLQKPIKDPDIRTPELEKPKRGSPKRAT
jgi:putative DNA primase/helicase